MTERGWPSFSTSACSGRSSVSEMVRPLFRKAISWKRRESVSKEYSRVSKMSPSAQKVTEVPFSETSSFFCSGAVGTPIL